MSITLTHGTTELDISDRLDWIDEYEWSPVEQSSAYSTTGALLIDVAVKQAGQPITLAGTETAVWLSRAVCDTLHGWASLPGITLTLVLRGVARTVIFDHAKGGFSARPIWKLLDGEITPELLYVPTFRFLDIGVTNIGNGNSTGTGTTGTPPRTGANNLVTTNPLPIANGRATLPSTPLGGVVLNLAQVYLDLQPTDLLPGGALRYDRAYLVAEYAGVSTAGNTLVFTAADAAEVNGRYAVVSYFA